MIGLPGTVTACLFDLDGVLTSTAALHLRAWRRTFDEVLHEQAPGQPAFTDQDYATYVDGRSRLDGVRAFLGSRGIELPEGSSDDPVDAATVHGIGNRKNERLLRVIADNGVSPYPGSVRYLEAVHRSGLAIGVVTSSANGELVLDAAGLTRYVRARVDGLTLDQEGLPGKPAPDSFLACARRLGVTPAETAVFEDAQAGVAAGKAGGFGYVVGVDRVSARAGPGAEEAGEQQKRALTAQGADIVVDDLADLLETDVAEGGT